ncbi:MAG: T9SS type A sorting domain-containing protein [Bacteroidetes bacterium]|nr:T9SS type A sorting domain-containing protein [Bacteroidota bacterium]
MQKFDLLILSVILLSASTVGAQPKARVFFDDNESMTASSVVTSKDGGFVISGQKAYNSLFLKTDSEGTILWKRQLKLSQTSTQSSFTELIPTSDSNYLFAGNFYDQVLEHDILLIAKVAESGDTIWTKGVNFGYNLTITSLKETPDKGFVICGYTSINIPPYNQQFVCKLSQMGNFVWGKLLTSLDSGEGNGIRPTQDNGFILAGFAQQNTPYYGYASLVKLDAEGNISWGRKLSCSTTTNLYAFDVEAIQDGFLVCMKMDAYNGDVILSKTDLLGNILWSKTYTGFYSGGISNNQQIRIHKLSDGNFIMVHSGEMRKIDPSGNTIWSRSPFMDAVDMAECTDKSMLIIGNGPLLGVKQPLHYLPHIGIIRADSAGENGYACLSDGFPQQSALSVSSKDTTFTAVDAGSFLSAPCTISEPTISSENGCVSFIGGLPEKEQQNDIDIYPNPSSGYISIRSNVNSELQLTEIIDSFGKTVFTSTEPGIISSSIELKSYSAGFYLLRIKFKSGTFARKFMVNK